ncbi:RNAse P, Rpr2/Rpp21 subunit [Methanosalsum zhilinae DSM 4017]|uniref:Ribonuclease P protein component 4 n=1 Tax=Methanosalsum zhilinae (strain DSM 4017 / NBRC 107636 / OCM 62 / WeN5) TaxID=679901 RepID=F7XQM5_METZD|nr:ribonuclease P protein component 4 [Methanosalsum zhilinae]AEH61624.1 RNAse P, Rpr2/Rpp21 subunit [Methanosalsum zhilinae DSM 4017]
MGRNRRKKKAIIRDLASQRIERLFKLAELEHASNPQRSNRYVSLARKIGMRHRVSIPSHLRRRVCRCCDTFLVPGSSSRIRLRRNYILITCLNCGRHMRFPYDLKLEDS